MKRPSLRWLALALVLTCGVPATALAGPSGDSLVDLAAGRGASLGFGFGVSPLHWDVIALPPLVPGARAAETATLLDLEPSGRAVSFDVKLRWPWAEPTSILEPYVVLGPALFVDRPHDAFSLIPADPVLRLGAKAGAGFNWRLTRDATLFGSYDVSTAGAGGPTSVGEHQSTNEMNRYDILYGIRFRY